jgi:hypothetical protein
VQWSGPPVVGGGVSVLYFAGDVGPPDVAAVKAAYTAQQSFWSSSVTITVPGSGDVIEDTTGTLVDVWTAAGGGSITGTNVGSTAAGVGACVGWITGGIVNGRRLRGRTFLVPLTTNSYDNDGTLNGSALVAAGTWANDLMAASPLAVWHRPTAPGAADGNSYGVIANRLRDKVAILTSRRD